MMTSALFLCDSVCVLKQSLNFNYLSVNLPSLL
ncbi:hypothetical protein FHS92_002105 [Sphingobium subterraneum]|uniref:Uncharacterized protein n=1 Tax=Sphingobium subterraneum TaxID=627688 RepID=A0A841J145_9SPHN|nr:hypothetical protein [Sphingobium subterraneum]